ncbi:MAG: sulfurtransferase [Micromonosporaceae bacterium]|nr:sulfurtransferase [Micromonosporaceae bacterium]
MKRVSRVAAAVVLASSLIVGGSAHAAEACWWPPGPIVSTGWLAANSGQPGLIVVDVRTADEYAAGHIAGSISIPMVVPFSAWITMRDDLLLELPEASELFASLGAAGITKYSKVVLVTSTGEPPYPEANATRAADTLLYAGVKYVSILNGGYPKWVAEGRPTTTGVPVVTPVTYDGTVKASLFSTIDDVHSSIGQSLIIDARDANVYSGEVIEEWAQKAGHIPTAVSLPAPSIWNADGTYKSVPQLMALAMSAGVTLDRNQTIIVYCGVGGYASSWLYVLNRVLGYKNVTMYDGSAQEWVRFYDMEL